MFLSAIDLDKVRSEKAASRPFIVTKDSPRKAYFKRINRDKRLSKNIKRYRDTGIATRGNIWAGNANGQRVVVKINPVKNKARKISSALNNRGSSGGGAAANLSAHISYISRSGAGKNEEKAVLFDRKHDGIQGREFFEKSRDDRHHFRMILSPENGDKIEDFQGYVRDVMARVEKDLGTELDWISAVHYDTDDIHAHVVIRGKNDRGADLVIARDYIASGLRMRAQERATELLGERSLEEISKSIEKEIDALRVTSLDRFLENNMDSTRKVDVRRENNFGKSRDYEQALKGRLRYLETTGLATQHPPGVFTLEEGFKDVLYGIQNRKDVLRQLHGRMNEAELDGLSLYSIKAGEGELIEGFVRDIGFVNEITDKKYLVLEDMEQKLHYIPAGENMRADELEKGSMIRVRPGDRSSGKADYNINMIARHNEGVYDIEKHRAYIEAEMDFIEPDNRQGYLDSHIKRIETLEHNGVIERLDEGRYRIPDDVITRGEEITREINERESKRFYPLVDILTKEPLKELVGAEKKTWLDKELFKNTRGKSGLASGRGPQVEEALEARKSWLIERDLAFTQSNGDFAYRDGAFKKLNVMEVLNAGETLAEQARTEFYDRKVLEGKEYQYIGFVTLETGHWAVVANTDGQLQMAQLDEKPDFEQGVCVEFTIMEGAMFEMNELERSKDRQKARDIDSEEEMEL